jgi:hypothetical protein
MAKNTPHGDHKNTLGAQFAPTFHRPWLRYIEPVDGAEGDTPPDGDKPADENTDWKAESRKWEARAKENAAKAKVNEGAAQRLKEIEDADKSEAEKAAARAEAAEKRAAEAEAKALRAEVAASKGVPVELLSGSTKDEMVAAADSLIKFREEASGPRAPRPDPNQGKPPAAGGTAGDQFAAFLTEALGQ